MCASKDKGRPAGSPPALWFQLLFSDPCPSSRTTAVPSLTQLKTERVAFGRGAFRAAWRCSYADLAAGCHRGGAALLPPAEQLLQLPLHKHNAGTRGTRGSISNVSTPTRAVCTDSKTTPQANGSAEAEARPATGIWNVNCINSICVRQTQAPAHCRSW